VPSENILGIASPIGLASFGIGLRLDDGVSLTTDVMPLTHRAKYTMMVRSTVALALFGLIVARAVNALTGGA
jgi:hypothetical protein